MQQSSNLSYNTRQSFSAGPFPSPSFPSLGIVTAQMPDIAFGIVELHENLMRWSHFSGLSKSISMSALKSINCTAELGVICKFAEGTVSPITCVIDEDVE